MSVLKNKRSVSGVQFLDTAYELNLFTLRLCSNDKVIPKRYTFTIAHQIIAIAQNIHSCVKRGNSIFPSTARDVEMRMEQFIMAGAELQNLISQINIVYELFSLPDKTMIRWMKLIKDEIALIKSVIKKDKERFKKI